MGHRIFFFFAFFLSIMTIMATAEITCNTPDFIIDCSILSNYLAGQSALKSLTFTKAQWVSLLLCPLPRCRMEGEAYSSLAKQANLPNRFGVEVRVGNRTPCCTTAEPSNTNTIKVLERHSFFSHVICRIRPNQTQRQHRSP